MNDIMYNILQQRIHVFVKIYTIFLDIKIKFPTLICNQECPCRSNVSRLQNQPIKTSHVFHLSFFPLYFLLPMMQVRSDFLKHLAPWEHTHPAAATAKHSKKYLHAWSL